MPIGWLKTHVGADSIIKLLRKRLSVRVLAQTPDQIIQARSLLTLRLYNSPVVQTIRLTATDYGIAPSASIGGRR